jgi:predicted TIM-barrel fold metal-dependent hydrolase
LIAARVGPAELSGLGLPDEVLQKVLLDNGKRLLGIA